jgi:hypothetical protein
MMTRAIVTAVSADGLQCQALRLPQRMPTGWIDVFSPLGLVATVQIGDQVALCAVEGRWEDGMVLAWRPTADQAAAALALVASANGATLPTQTDPSQAIGNAALSGVKSR